MTVSTPLDDPTITEILDRWSGGDRTAAEELLARVYPDLRQIAGRIFRGERRDHTLQPTALVHEAYLQLAEQSNLSWNDRQHFYRLAARVMRRVLVAYSRQHKAAKRGHGAVRIPIDDADGIPHAQPAALLALDDALRDLARQDPDQALLVELRYYVGLSIDEIADCLDSSPRTVARQWRHARAVLYAALSTEQREAL